MNEADACGGVAVEEAAGIICSLRAGDLAGWTPPWRNAPLPPSVEPGEAATTTKEEEKAWPAVTRGKRSRSSRRRSPSGSGSAAKGRWARGSPASPLDYSVGSGSGASTSGGEDGAFCSPPAPAVPRAPAAVQPSPSAKVGLVGARRPSTLPAPVPVPPPRPAGQRSRKKMRLPEVQQLVQSLAAENDGLRKEMQSLRRACTALSKENGTLETRLEHSSSSKRKRTGSEEEEEEQQQQQGKLNVAERSAATNGFVLPDLNIPAQDVADGSAVAAP